MGSLDTLVAEHPLRERLWAQLMLALYRSGRPGEALRRSAELRGLLRDELGLSPSAEVRELECDILAERPELTWAQSAPTPVLSRATGAPGLASRPNQDSDVTTAPSHLVRWPNRRHLYQSGMTTAGESSTQARETTRSG
jgi:hypothetical protein